MKQITMMCCAVLLLLSATNTSSASEPEDTIRSYVTTFASQDFRGAMAWFHPNYLAAIREKIAGIIGALRQEDQLKVISEYGAKTIDEFKAIPTSEIVAINMRNKFGRMSKEQLELVKTTRVEIVKSTRLSDGTHEIEARTVIIHNGREYEKRERYTLTAHEKIWKISGSRTYDEKYRDKSGIELFAPNQAL